MQRTCLTAVVLSCLHLSSCSFQGRTLKILAAPAPVYSHWVPHINIAKELAARGHQVKVLHAAEEQECADRLNIPKEWRISFPNTSPSNKLVLEAMKMIQDGRQKDFSLLLPLHYDYCKGAIDNTEVMSLIQEWEPDVVMIDGGFPTGAPVADKLSLPKVVVWVIGPLGPLVTQSVGTPSAPSLMPAFTGWQKQPMGLLGRLKSAVGWGVGQMILKGFSAAYDPLWKDHGMPHLSYQASLRRAAAVIYQSSFAAIPAIPMSPHAHVLGSLTAKAAQPLPKTLAEYCAQHSDGAIYISTGSSAIPDVDLMRGINQAIEQVQAPVIWKLTQHDQEVLRQHNVTTSRHAHVVPFVPQNDLLGSHCVRAFVTQGGSNSFYEALHHGVPMVILPLLVEQPWNAAQAAALGFGIHIDLPMPTQPAAVVGKLGPALTQMLGDPSYAAKAQHISRLMQAQRWSPIEQAANIVEHVGWTNGSMHNHMLQLQPSWVAVHMVDVAMVAFATVALIILLPAYGSWTSINWLVRKIQLENAQRQKARKHE